MLLNLFSFCVNSPLNQHNVLFFSFSYGDATVAQGKVVWTGCLSSGPAGIKGRARYGICDNDDCSYVFYCQQSRKIYSQHHDSGNTNLAKQLFSLPAPFDAPNTFGDRPYMTTVNDLPLILNVVQDSTCTGNNLLSLVAIRCQDIVCCGYTVRKLVQCFSNPSSVDRHASIHTIVRSLIDSRFITPIYAGCNTNSVLLPRPSYSVPRRRLLELSSRPAARPEQRQPRQSDRARLARRRARAAQVLYRQQRARSVALQRSVVLRCVGQAEADAVAQLRVADVRRHDGRLADHWRRVCAGRLWHSRKFDIYSVFIGIAFIFFCRYRAFRARRHRSRSAVSPASHGRHRHRRRPTLPILQPS
jgi:hypothetical protein